MKERPIIQGHTIAGRMPVFQRWGRDAIRDDRKTQTRRVAAKKFWPIFEKSAEINGYVALNLMDGDIVCPYGKIGDIRVMTEPLIGWDTWAYYADDINLRPPTPVISNITGEHISWRWKVQTLSSLFMPYEAARTLCRIIDIRAERVGEINGNDVVDEGIDPRDDLYGHSHHTLTIRADFAILWDSINAKKGYPFAANNWIWKVVFKRI